MSSVASILATTLATAMNNVLAGAQQQVTGLNANLAQNYMQVDWQNFLLRFAAGQPATPPIPPNGYIVGEFVDPTNPVAVWAYPVQGNVPVCAQPPLPTAPEPAPVNTAVAASRIGDKQNVPVGDTMPVGFKATAPDGSVWEKFSSATPFGVAQYYERVA